MIFTNSGIVPSGRKYVGTGPTEEKRHFVSSDVTRRLRKQFTARHRYVRFYQPTRRRTLQDRNPVSTYFKGSLKL